MSSYNDTLYHPCIQTVVGWRLILNGKIMMNVCKYSKFIDVSPATLLHYCYRQLEQLVSYMSSYIAIPYCLKLWLISYKHQVLFSGRGIARYNIIKHQIQCFTHHQFPSEFIASITDYKQHVDLLLINACLIQWPG